MSQSAQTATTMSAKGWRFAFLSLVVSLLAILVLYRETAMSMVEIWERSETFTHGFLVPPIALWLIWRLRNTIALLAPRPNPFVLFAIAVSGFVWLLGQLATVATLSQFAFTTMLVLAVPVVLGIKVTQRIAFPLAFLYFAVPFGEFALPQLMEWTANFTVLGLRLSGIPVYREGLHFVIPSGSWSVVEACSGVRYIIASLTVGTLFAYLSYHSIKRRLIFVGFAFVVPVIANWMRAYMIVMIGHLSGNKLAVGVDHLIYGWVFFGIVIMTMFWIGSRWREDHLPSPLECAAPTDLLAVRGSNSSFVIVALVVTVLVAVWPFALWQIERRVPEQISHIELPEPIAGWSISQDRFSDWTPRFDNASANVQSTFVSDGRMAGVYLAYYRNQDSGRKMVSTSNVLVRSNDVQWAIVAGGAHQIALGSQSVDAHAAELRSVDGTRMLAWQWYWVNGHLTGSDFKAKALTAFSRLAGQGDDSAVIVVYAPKDQTGGGEAVLADFAKTAWPTMERALNRAREKR
jgi:exosortase A